MRRRAAGRGPRAAAGAGGARGGGGAGPAGAAARRRRRRLALSAPREPAAAAAAASQPAQPTAAARRRHGALHRDRQEVPLPVEHHRHRVSRPGAEGRRLDRGHEGDRPSVCEGGKTEVEEAARQLPRRAEAAERDPGARPRRRGGRQARLPLEVHGRDAVPAAAHERAQEAGRLAAGRARQRARRARRPRRRRHLQRLRLRAGHARRRRAARRHRPQARLPVPGAQAAAPRAARARRRRRRARRLGAGGGRLAARPAGHLLQRHVPVDEAAAVPGADQDQEDAVRGGDRGGGGAAAAGLRGALARRRLLRLQRRQRQRLRRPEAGLSAETVNPLSAPVYSILEGILCVDNHRTSPSAAVPSGRGADG